VGAFLKGAVACVQRGRQSDRHSSVAQQQACRGVQIDRQSGNRQNNSAGQQPEAARQAEEQTEHPKGQQAGFGTWLGARTGTGGVVVGAPVGGC
jgi:hypothetical protein